MSAQSATTVEYAADQLSKLMSGKDTLAGWDVLVSYEQTALNKLLAAQHDKVGSDKTTIKEFEVKYKDDEEKDQIRVYNLKLGRPSMKFLDRQASVQIDFPLSGTTKRKSSGTVVTLKPNIFLKCKTRLVTVKGSSGSSVPKDPSDPKLAGRIVAFKPDEQASYFVAITLSDVDVEVGDATGDNSVLSALISAPLKTYLHDSGIVYYLTGVNNHTPPSGSIILKPSKFIVTSVVGDKPAATDVPPRCYLLTWISLEGSTSSPRDNTDNSPLLFTVDDKNQISPVAKDHSASVIISHDIFYKRFIKENLTKKGYSEITDTSSLGSSTVTFTAKVSSDVVKVDKIQEDNKDKRYCNSVEFNMNEKAASFTFEKGNAKIHFDKDMNGIEFGEYQLYTDSSGIPDRKWVSGKATFKFVIDGSGTWVQAGNNLALTISVPSSFNVDVSVEDPGWYYRTFGGRLKNIFDSMKNVQAKVASITFDFGGMDYFLTTNLFAPDQTVFEASPIAEGLFMPRDMLLCGKVAEVKGANVSNTASTTTQASMASSSPGAIQQGNTFHSIMMAEAHRTDSIVQDKQPNLQTLVADLCHTTPPSELRKALMPFFLSGQNASQDNFETIMQKFGYGAITEEELQHLIGLSAIPGVTAATLEIHPEAAGLDTRNGIANGASNTNLIALSRLEATSSGEPVQFDVGVFGGLYKVNSANPPVKEFFISSQTAQLQMGDKWYSTTTTMESDGGFKVHWSDQTSNYAVIFKSSYDSNAQVLHVRFTGSRSTSTGEQSDFNGELASRPLRANDKVLQAGGGMDTFIIIATIVGFMAAVPALMFYITCMRKAYQKCRGREKVAIEQGKQAEAEAAKKQGEAIREIVEIVVDKVQKKSEPNLKNAVQLHIRDTLPPERREALLRDLRTTIEQSVRERYENSDIWRHPEQILDPTRIDPALETEIMKRVESIGRTWTNANMGAEAIQFAQGFGEALGIDSSTVKRLANESIDLERIRTLDRLMTGDHREVIQSGIADSMNRFNTEVQEHNILRWDQREPNNVTNHNQAKSRLEAALREEAEFKKREPPQEEKAREQYEMEKRKMENELKDSVDNEKRERETLENERKSRSEADSRRQKLEEEKMELEKRKSEAEKKFREGK